MFINVRVGVLAGFLLVEVVWFLILLEVATEPVGYFLVHIVILLCHPAMYYRAYELQRTNASTGS